MGDHHQGSRPAVQHVLHRCQGVGVQVVGGLVKHQDIRFAHQQAQQLQPPPFAAGQLPNRSPLPLGAEAQLLHELAGGQLPAAHVEDPLLVFDDLDDAQVRHLIQFLDFLRQDRGLHRLAALQPSCRGFDVTVEQAQQRGFAGTVDAYQAQPFARGQAQGDVPEQVGVPEPQGNVFQVQDVLAEPGRGHLVQGQRVAGFRDVGNQGVCRLDAELGFGRTGGCAAAQPGQFLLDQLLALVFHHGRHPVTLGPRQYVGGIAAVERLHHRVVHFPGPGADLIQEPPVVGDYQQAAVGGPPALLQVPGQPGHTFHVQVVGGLVKHNDVVVPGQQFGQGDPPLLSARKRGDLGVPVHFLDQSAHDVADPRVRSPLVVCRVPHNRLADGQVAVQHIGLVQVSHGDVATAGNTSVVGGLPLGQQAHQGRLAVTVAADHADPVAFFQAEGNPVQDGAGAKGNAEVFSTKQVCQSVLLSVRRWCGGIRVRLRQDDGARRRAVDGQGVVPLAAQCSLQCGGVGCIRGQERKGGAGTGNHSGQGAVSGAGCQDGGQFRRELQRGRLQVIFKNGCQAGGVPGRQGSQYARVYPGRFGYLDAGPEGVRGGVDLRRGKPVRGRDQDPVQRVRGGHRCEPVPHSQSGGSPAHQGERHVGAQPGGQLRQIGGGQAGLPELVAGHQGGGGIGRSSTHAARDGYPLGNVQMDPRLPASRPPGNRAGGPGRKVAPVQRDAVHGDTVVRVADGEPDLVSRQRGGSDFLEQGDGQVNAGDAVVTVRTQRTDVE